MMLIHPLWKLGLVLGLCFLLYLRAQPGWSEAARVSWDGGGSTLNWSDCANWDSDTCPGADTTIVFNKKSTKDAVVDSAFGEVVSSILINPGYTGTISLARVLRLTARFRQSAGTFDAADQPLEMDSDFTLNAGGVFRASSTTTSFGDAFTINGGTFDTTTNSGGTVIFDGTDGILSCNNVRFNLVTIANTSSNKLVTNTCSLPLGSNPTIARGVTLEGTLSGTGILTVSASSLTLNSGARLVGFTGLRLAYSGNLVVDGALADFSSYSPFSVSGGISLVSGILTLPNQAALFGGVTLSGGTFNASDGTMTLSGGLTISGSVVFNANNGTIVFNRGGTLQCNHVHFHQVVINAPGDVATNIGHDCALPLGDNPRISRVRLSGTLIGSGTLTATSGGSRINAGGTLSGFSGLIMTSLRVDGADLNCGGYDPMQINQLFELDSGSFTAPTGAMYVGGGFNHKGGAFDPNGGTVILGEFSPEQYVQGSTTFNNLTKIATAPESLFFSPNATLTVLGTLTLHGAGADNLLSLGSTVPGTQWAIDANRLDLANLRVQDSQNIGQNVLSGTHLIDGGNNMNWSFTKPIGEGVGQNDARSARS